MNISVIRRRAPSVVAACLLVGAGVLAPQVASAEPPHTIARPDYGSRTEPRDGHSAPSRQDRDTSEPPSHGDSPSSQRYRTCAQVLAQGAWPLYRGDPGYNPALDKDNDGIACN